MSKQGAGRESKEDREDRLARKEARQHGYEYRPGNAKNTDEARRLEAGFELMQEGEDDNGDGD